MAAVSIVLQVELCPKRVLFDPSETITNPQLNPKVSDYFRGTFLSQRGYYYR